MAAVDCYSIYLEHAPVTALSDAARVPAGLFDRFWTDAAFLGDPALLRSLWPWLALDFRAALDYEVRDFSEGWSCFSGGGHIFIARHTLTPEGHCLTCARVWKAASLPPDYDPGALIGHPEHFSHHAGPIRSMQAPAMPWARLLETHGEAAVRFVSHVWAAMKERRPLIVVNEKYGAGAPVYGLLALARAALPHNWRDECKLRIYTRHPARFAGEFGANVVVTPFDEVELAIKHHPGSTVLANDGSFVWGKEADETHGRMLLESARDFPAKLFAFSARFRPAHPAVAARELYNLIGASGNAQWMDELLRYWLRTADGTGGTIDWEQIVEPDEWRQFGPAALADAVFATGASAAGIRAGAIRELTGRGLSLDHAADRLWAIQGDRLRLVYDCAAAGLLSPRTVSHLIARLTSDEVWTALARRDLCGWIVDATKEVAMPGAWRQSPSPHVDVFSAAIHILAHCRVDAARKHWVELAWKQLEHALEQKRPLPLDPPAGVSVLPPGRLIHRVMLTELLFRARWPGVPVWQAMAGIADPRERLQVAYRIGDPHLTCLNTFRIPEDWSIDPKAMAEYKGLNNPKLRKTLASVAPGAFPSELAFEIDMRMASGPDAVTKALLQSSRWLEWRQRSGLDPGGLRSCAIQWLVCEVRERRWEEWEQVIADLKNLRLTAAEINGISRRGRLPWPWIEGHEDQQAESLVGIADGPAAVDAIIAAETESVRVAEAKQRLSAPRSRPAKPGPPRPAPAEEPAPRTVVAAAAASKPAPATEPNRALRVSVLAARGKAEGMNPAEWPALKGVEFPCRITYRRAAYGKIHRATTDFRWIGASLGFSKYRKQLREFFVPESHRQGDIPLWWCYEGRYYASFCRWSRAADDAGRCGLETQILEWTPEGAPPALAALVLLPAVADLTDVDWFDTWRDPRWQDQDHETTFQPARIEVTVEEAEAAICEGLAALGPISEKLLAQFYSNLLAGVEPSALPGFEKPIRPRALAALLLAAQPEEAARWNLAGWPVANPKWSGVVCASPLPPVAKGVPLKDEERDRAAMMASAVVNVEPRRAAGPAAAPVASKPAPAAPPVAKPPSSRDPAPVPPEPERDQQWSALAALSLGNATDPCWKAMAEEVRSRRTSGSHPLRRLAVSIRNAAAVHTILEINGWRCLQRVLAAEPILLDPQRDETEALAALELAAVLRHSEPIVKIALDLIKIDTARLRDRRWTQALLRGFHKLPRRTGEPHPADSCGPSTLQLRESLAVIDPKLAAQLDDARGRRPEADPEPDRPDDIQQRRGPRSPDAKPPETNPEPLTGIAAALAKGDATNSAWNEAARIAPKVPGDGHPLTLLAQGIERLGDRERVALRERGWETLKRVIDRLPALAHPAANARVRLPAFYLAKVLRPDVDPETIAGDLVLAQAHAEHLERTDWWSALFDGLKHEQALELVRTFERSLPIKVRVPMQVAFRTLRNPSRDAGRSA